VSKDESRKLQSLIDEHLRAKGITSLLDDPISIIDVDKFQEELDNTLNPKTKELKRTNRLKHKIKVELENNPDFYKPLAERLEELIEQRRKNQISQMEMFKEFDQIQEKIVNQSKEAQQMGFSSNREFAVYKTLENTVYGAKDLTHQIFDGIQEELTIIDWDKKNEVSKAVRVKIKDAVRDKVDAKDLHKLAVSLVDLIKRN
jgi:type I restriction enzyme R subunit